MAVSYGTCEVRGRGNKKGSTVELTYGQRAALDAALGVSVPGTGDLRDLEAAYRAGVLPDYPLFPGGELTTRDRGGSHAGAGREIPPVFPVATARRRRAALRPMSYNTVWRAFGRVMTAAKIAPQRRLGWYGMRRGSVDAADALNVSAGALQQLGGWTSAETPLAIYKDRENVADRRAARDVRAPIRGEDSTPAGQ
jgi:hypothetical protein